MTALYGDSPIPPNSQRFKTDHVRCLRNVVGLNIVRAHGKANTTSSDRMPAPDAGCRR